MTRRLTVVILSVVLATLLIVGAGTVVLANVRARHATEDELRTQVADLANGINQLLDVGTQPDTPAGRKETRRRLRALTNFRRVLRLEEVVVVTVTGSGEFLGDPLPQGVTTDDVDLVALRNGQVLSGNSGNTVYAIAATPLTGSALVVVVATRDANAGLGASVRLFLLASAATLALGLGAAILLGRRLTRPIRDASATTQRLAAGELAARLPDPPPSQHDELADLTRNINDMAAGLERSRVLEQQFLLSVSHDLRTPLTSIRGFAEAITDGAAEPQRAAAVITSEARRLERLVADLLDLAKLQAETFSLSLREVDLAEAVGVAAAGFAREALDRQVRIDTSAMRPLSVMADPDRLAQVVANLIDNALRYARKVIWLTVHSEGDQAVLTVDDDGPGIPVIDLPHVFERLYVSRARPSRIENSSGLGLAIVKELVEAMGGQVAAGPAPGEGARLSVWLPLASRSEL